MTSQQVGFQNLTYFVKSEWRTGLNSPIVWAHWSIKLDIISQYLRVEFNIIWTLVSPCHQPQCIYNGFCNFHSIIVPPVQSSVLQSRYTVAVICQFAFQFKKKTTKKHCVHFTLLILQLVFRPLLLTLSSSSHTGSSLSLLIMNDVPEDARRGRLYEPVVCVTQSLHSVLKGQFSLPGKKMQDASLSSLILFISNQQALWFHLGLVSPCTCMLLDD